MLLVILRHASNPFYKDVDFKDASWNFFHFVRNGTIGVDLFFVLSGFLITYSIIRLRESQKQIYIPLYLAKRILRIFPAYYFVLFLVVAGLIPYYDLQTSITNAFYHFIYLQDYTGNNIVVTFWSLGVEEKFYLFVPIALYLIFKIQKLELRFLAIFAIILAGPLSRYIAYLLHPDLSQTQYYLAHTYMPLFYYPFHTCLDPLFIGVLCSLIYQNADRLPWCHNQKWMDGLFWLSTSIVIILLFSHVLLSTLTLFDIVWLRFIISLGFGGILLSLALGYGAPTLFRSRWLLFFAIISYSLYLVHMPLQPMILHGLKSVSAYQHLSLSMQCLIFYPIFIILSIMAALLLYYLIEKPFLILKDNVT